MISKLKNKYQELKKESTIKKIETERPVLSDFKNKALCVFSSPRGGSTWLTEMLNEAGNFVVVNEPFFQGRYRTDKVMPSLTEGRPFLKNLGYWFYQPINKESQREIDEVTFNHLFSGKYLHPRITPYSDINQLKDFDQVLVKFCYGNLMLPWIVDHFDIAAVLLTRHPCAVIASQLKVKGAFKHVSDYPAFHLPKFLGSNYFDQYREILQNIKRPEENLAAIWAITVDHITKHPYNNKKWLTVKYETMLSNPQDEFNRIKKWAPGYQWNDEEPNFQTPSRATLDNGLKSHFQKGTQLTKWKQVLSASQVANIKAVLTDFEVNLYDY